MAAGVKIAELVNTDGSDVTPTGTVSTSGTTVTVTGGGDFEVYARVGGSIIINGERRFIVSITDIDHLEMNAALTTPASGDAYILLGQMVGRTVSSGTEPILPASFRLPADDPTNIDSLVPFKSFLYDAGLALIVYAMEKDSTRGQVIVDAITTCISETEAITSATGSLCFSASLWDPTQDPSGTVRSGASA